MAREEELAAVRDRLFGLIDERDIRLVDIPRPGSEVIERFRALTDLSSTVSDALDDVGLGGVIAGSVIAPRSPGARIVGPAVTIRYAREGGTAGAHIARGARPRLADRDLYAVGREGDVAVFDTAGASEASVMGGLSARWARRLGIAGCVVDGAVRDLDSVRAAGVPVWSRSVTPLSGKHRMQALEINGRVALAGSTVVPGDLVVADSAGICVVPAFAVADVLARCEAEEASERAVVRAIEEGASREDVERVLPPQRW